VPVIINIVPTTLNVFLAEVGASRVLLSENKETRGVPVMDFYGLLGLKNEDPTRNTTAQSAISNGVSEIEKSWQAAVQDISKAKELEELAAVHS
jgi:hypothetical protein